MLASPLFLRKIKRRKGGEKKRDDASMHVLYMKYTYIQYWAVL